MFEPFVTVQDKKVYVAGGDSPVDDAKHQVYEYDVNTDHWGQLPPSGHFMVFLTSLVASWLLLVVVCLILRK